VLAVYNYITAIIFLTEISMWVVLKEMRPTDNYISASLSTYAVRKSNVRMDQIPINWNNLTSPIIVTKTFNVVR
jgi:hypothetical protein